MRIYVNIVNSTASCLGSNLVHVLEAIDASLWYVVSRARRPWPKGLLHANAAAFSAWFTRLGMPTL